MRAAILAIGGFVRKMREADGAAINRVRVYADTRGALQEAGNLLQPVRRKVNTAAKVQGDLAELCRGDVKGRKKADEITLFKSVGLKLEDVAAAKMAWKARADVRA